MLVLSRKANECVVIGSDIRVYVLEANGNRVKLGFVGPPGVQIFREEVYDRMQTPEGAREYEPAR